MTVTPSPVERMEVNAFVFDQLIDWGSDTFPCRPSASYTLRATWRTGPHCIGPNTAFDAEKSR